MKKRNAISSLVSLLLISACTSSTVKTDDQKDTDNSVKISLFYGGNVITVAENQSKKENFWFEKESNPAVLVVDGKINFVGPFEQATDKLDRLKKQRPQAEVSYVNLNGRTLMPGFIEPHAHLHSTAQTSVVQNLMPCLPDKYQKKLNEDYGWIYYPNKQDSEDQCFLYLDLALDKVKNSPAFVTGKSKIGDGDVAWHIGNGLDPSRMVFSRSAKYRFNEWLNENRKFFNYPMKYIYEGKINEQNSENTKTAIFMSDQSGHLAYANMNAFEEVGLCSAVVSKAQLESIEKKKVTDFVNALKIKNPTYKFPKKPFHLVCDGTKEKVETSQFIVKNLCFSDGGLGIVKSEDDDKDWQYSGLIKEPSAYMFFINAIMSAQSGKANKLTGLIHHAAEPSSTNNCPLSSTSIGKANAQQGQDTPDEDTLLRMEYLLNTSSQQGVTMLVDGGTTTEMKNDFIKLVNRKDRQATRIRSVYDWRSFERSETSGHLDCYDNTNNLGQCGYIPFDSTDFNGMYSAQGIKLLADGSTQGCSASLSEAYSGSGLCKEFDKGHIDYEKDEIIKNLSPFLDGYKFGQPWYFNLHANGDKAITDSLDALKQMADDNNNAQFKVMPHTIIHSTVNDIDEELGDNKAIIHSTINKRPDDNKTINQYVEMRKTFPNLTPSHLIGHVAYWGASMKNELGELRGERIDPMEEELNHGIEFSLHSDLSISPLFPLWFIEQAMTRHTWEYPELAGDGKPLGEKSTLDIKDAIKAVTLVPAKQHNLADKLGSIEVGKIADLIVLDQNLMKFQSTPELIHTIAVECAFVSGEEVEWVNLKTIKINDKNSKPDVLASKCVKSDTLN